MRLKCDYLSHVGPSYSIVTKSHGGNACDLGVDKRQPLNGKTTVAQGGVMPLPCGGSKCLDDAAICYLGSVDESVAQLVEHRPFKALVLGSSPSALTIKSTTYSSHRSMLRTPRPRP